MRIINVVGARPNFMKIAPLMAEYRTHGQIESLLVHTGQHYDQKMSDVFFHQLGIPNPDINLEVGSSSHACQTAEIMKAFEPIVLNQAPDLVLVVGDVNSTIACSLVATKLNVRVAHVEAGLRSFDRSMPEEINRILTDAISDLLFCTEQSGIDNLTREGIPKKRMFLVGNLMIDTLLRHKATAETSDILNQLDLNGDGFAVLTLHRPSNVDDVAVFSRILDAVEVIQAEVPVVFPAHPRTLKNLAGSCLGERVARLHNLRLTDPLGYIDFLKLMSCAKVVLTDSGGIQEETTILGVPCLTLRENTERPITVAVGANRIVGTDTSRIIEGFREAVDMGRPGPEVPPLWDGRTAERIVRILLDVL